MKYEKSPKTLFLMVFGDFSMSHPVPNLGCRPFFAENCPLDSFPGAANPK